MNSRATALTGAAGEHFVAFRLSELGYPVALTRGGSPVVDILVGDLAGQAAVSIQVKTSSGARREYARAVQNSHWEWDVGQKAQGLRGAWDLITDLLRPSVGYHLTLPRDKEAAKFAGGYWEQGSASVLVTPNPRLKPTNAAWPERR